jgi:hypothetical protein
MMMRGGYPFEENSIGPGALRFDADNRTSNKHFRQQFNRQFNQDGPDSAGGWLPAATTVSTDFYTSNCEHANGRWLPASATVSTNFECTGQWVCCLRAL